MNNNMLPVWIYRHTKLTPLHYRTSLYNDNP